MINQCDLCANQSDAKICKSCNDFDLFQEKLDELNFDEDSMSFYSQDGELIQEITDGIYDGYQ